MTDTKLTNEYFEIWWKLYIYAKETVELIFLCRFPCCCIWVVRIGHVTITGKSQSLRGLKQRGFFLPLTKWVTGAASLLLGTSLGAETQRTRLHPSHSAAGTRSSQRREQRQARGVFYCLSPGVTQSCITYTHLGLPCARLKGLASVVFLVPKEEERTGNGDPRPSLPSGFSSAGNLQGHTNSGGGSKESQQSLQMIFLKGAPPAWCVWSRNLSWYSIDTLWVYKMKYWQTSSGKCPLKHWIIAWSCSIKQNLFIKHLLLWLFWIKLFTTLEKRHIKTSCLVKKKTFQRFRFNSLYFFWIQMRWCLINLVLSFQGKQMPTQHITQQKVRWGPPSCIHKHLK